MANTLDLARGLVGGDVAAAGWFAPNARGRWELSSWAGLADRHLLRARGADIGGRRLFALSHSALHVLQPWRMLVGRAEVVRWWRNDLLSRPVPTRGEPGAIALELFDRSARWPVAEVVPLDDGALRIMADLLGLSPDRLVHGSTGGVR